MPSANGLSDNYRFLLHKLDEFRRKYYKNLVLRGIIILFSISLISFLVVIFSEFIGHFSITVRTILFYLYLLINSAVLTYYVVIPLIKIYKPSNSLTYRQASVMIGKFFPEVKDKLLNTLELKEMADQSIYSRTLIEASIDQRINELKPVPFSFAINFSENRKYLKYLLIPLFILTILLFTTPKVVTESTERLVKHNTYYKKPAPFEFELLNKNLNAVKNEEFTLRLKVSGKSVPANVFIKIDNYEYLMKEKRNGVYEYTLKNVRNPLRFYFFSGNIKSETFKLNVLPKPLLKGFTVSLNYPAYTGKKPETISNTGDFTIPEGTRVVWHFSTEDAEQLMIYFGDQLFRLSPEKRNTFSLSKTIKNNSSYLIKISNNKVVSKDTIQYYISVIPDAYPRIEAEQQIDSSNTKYLFFTGEAADDYGLRKLYFVYHFLESDDSSKLNKDFKISVPVTLNSVYQNFYYAINLDDLKISHGESFEYFFEVWDNDGVNGSKSTRSRKFFFAAPSEKQMQEMAEKSAEDLKKDIQNAAKKSQEIQKELLEAQKKLIDKNKMDWDDKKRIQELLNKQKDLIQQVEEMKEKYIENVQKQDDYQELSKELLEKYRQLYEKFEEIMPEDIKKLYEELEKLLEQNNKEGIQQELDKLKKDQKSLEKELDRMLELFKKLEFENKLDNITQKLDELSQKQEKLSEETEKSKEKEKESLEQKQEELNKEFKDLQEEFNELEKLNKNLENPKDLEDTKDDRQEIQEEQEKSMEEMQDNNMKKAAQNQKNASRKMKELSEKMKSMKMEMEMKSLEINYEKLRRILENLLHVSFEQEDLANQFKSVNSYNPKYVELTQKQKKLKDDMKLIEDSLFALSKELPMIESFVNKEVENVNYQMLKTIELLAERMIGDARTRQGYALTSINNLAVMLSELLKQMQEEMSNMKSSGKKSMKKKKKGGLPDLQKLQEELSKQIQDLKQQGNKPGSQMSKQLAQMAARQEMLRNAIRNLQKEMGAGDKANDELNKALQELQKLLEENEKDLVEGKITERTLKRQQDIKVKFLEAEKAEKKQDEEERRESKTANDIFNRKPPSLEEYLKNKQKEVELLKSVPPDFSPYYKSKVKEYFRLLPN